MIARAPGVGKKTAERLILDLRDKVAGLYDAGMAAIAAGAAGAAGGIGAGGYYPSADEPAGADDAVREAIEALTALGYSRAEASKAVRTCKENAAKNGTDPGDTESILKAALRYL